MVLQMSVAISRFPIFCIFVCLPLQSLLYLAFQTMEFGKITNTVAL